MGVTARRRLAFVIVTISTGSLAMANGAMGLALEMFEYRTWAVYVVAMIVLEAWLIGTKGGVDWPKSIGISLIANGITAYCCPAFFAVALHGFGFNPNPLMYVIQLLFFFGLGSAYLESIIWSFAKPTVDLPKPERRFGQWFQKSVVLRSFVTHMVGIPIALVILLSPSHPYKGLSSIVFYQRRIALTDVMKAFGQSLSGKAQVPGVHSLADLIDTYAPDFVKRKPDVWSIAYLPDYDRFDTTERRRIPWEWNAKAAGMRISTESGDSTSLGSIWLCRAYAGGLYNGFVLNRDDGEVHLSTDPQALGYPSRPRS